MRRAAQLHPRPLKSCPTTSFTRPGLRGLLICSSFIGRVMMSVRGHEGGMSAGELCCNLIVRGRLNPKLVQIGEGLLEGRSFGDARQVGTEQFDGA